MNTEDLVRELEDALADQLRLVSSLPGEFYVPVTASALRAAAARLRELDEALKPFGEASRDCDDPDVPDSVTAWESPEALHVCIRDFRRAAQLTEPCREP